MTPFLLRRPAAAHQLKERCERLAELLAPTSDAVFVQCIESICNLCGEQCDGTVGPRQFERLKELGDEVGVSVLLAKGVEDGKRLMVNAAEDLRFLLETGK